MIRIRPEVAALRPYSAGKTAAAVAEDVGLEPEDIIKLASNESAEGPFPGVPGVVALAITEANRYPDNAIRELSPRLAAQLELEPENLWFGAGSSANLREIALAIGGPDTSAVFPDPSFVIYQAATQLAGAVSKPVPLDSDHRVDLDGLLGAIDETTTVVYLCSPNNPTGTVTRASETRMFLDAVPSGVLVVVDEAYGEYVTDPAWESMITEAVQRPNVVVTRTFSKIYALASLRVGYAVGMAATLTELRKAQAPFTVTTVAQVAACESLRQPDVLADRRATNAAVRHALESGLADRSVVHVPSQANFVYLPSKQSADWFEGLQAKGVITRLVPGGLRVSVGSEPEIRRFFEAFDQILTR